MNDDLSIFTVADIQELIASAEEMYRILVKSLAGIPESEQPASKIKHCNDLKIKIENYKSEIELRKKKNEDLSMVCNALPKKILILAANPKTTSRLRLDEEVREIEEGLRRSIHRNQFDIHSKWAVRHRDIRQALLDYEPNIVHFTGHGMENGLLVEDELGMAVRFSTKALSELFKLCASHVECVILNACYSAPQATAINKHIDYVIGMKKEINDRAAIEFSIGFYDALGAGRSIEDAFAFGRAAILAQFPDLPEYHIPVLKTSEKSEMIKINVCIETTGDTFDVNASLDTGTAGVKKRLIDELRLSKTFEDGMLIPYYLLNKTRDTILDDTKTLRENGVRDNDVFVFLVEADDA